MYWYEKENGALLRFEKDAFLKFMREYNHPNMKMMFGYDNKHRFCVDITLYMNMIIREGMRMVSLVDQLKCIP